MTRKSRTGLAARGVVGALALALATTALTPGAWAQTANAPAAGTAVALPRAAAMPDFADLVARVAPAVVNVTVTGRTPRAPELPPQFRGTPFERFFREQMPLPRPRAGRGSGFIIDPAGYIVTNNHVVGDAASVTVQLADGREMPARVVGTDPQTDLALLKVEAEAPLPALEWGDSDRLRVGEWVVAMGNPFGLGGTATAGIVSARGRQIGAGPYDDFIQTDAPINPGNSGGPLFDVRGGVIGIATAIYSPSGANAGIGFAVPSNLARQVVDQLRATGRVERGWLGVSMQRLDEELARAVGAPDRRGALVAQVQEGSPAERAGLQPGDVVVGFGERAIEAPRDLAEAVAGVRPGGTATVVVLRNGERVERQVTVGRHPASRIASPEEREGAEGGALGLALAPGPRGEGAVVAEVRPDSAAAARGLRQGDVILRAGDRAVNGPEDVAQAVRAARQQGRQAIALQIERDGARLFVALPLQAG
ncbi:DegQ family serine endoprotease [Crenalkalicoccus roseus]|uniref:DegQ family serine endoprotease n=1 Tax=Crenalkalicoccus roseus TaxID=1485588 RepID=UPI001305222B|nr:DegQ family serine endoprotease [Crenalkalicoccus roseus]